MEISDILDLVREQYLKTGQVPIARSLEMRSAAVEGYRKIGSWRKVLWLAGVIPNERKNTLPRARALIVGKGVLK